MSCEWGYEDCSQVGKKCDLCLTEGFHYYPCSVRKKPGLAKRQAKPDGRMGSSSEFKNHVNNSNLLDGTTARMTPNSGAGYVKGDAEISGLVNIMEEIKTEIIKEAPGKETFKIHRAWLDKLNREAKQAHKDFWYLKFSFNEFQDQFYCITEAEVIMSMVNTIVSDRRKVNKISAEMEVLYRQKCKVEADLSAAYAEVALIKAQLNLERCNKN